jgi:hypothetical protein
MGYLPLKVFFPHNTIGFSGKSYDAKASLIDFSARWYADIAVDGIAGPQTYRALVQYGGLGGSSSGGSTGSGSGGGSSGTVTPPPPTRAEIIAMRSGHFRTISGGIPSYSVQTAQSVKNQYVFSILSHQVTYEGLEPILWSIGLVKELSPYDSFVLTDFHLVLEIGKNHSLDSLVNKVNPLLEKEVEIQKDISVLWHWRSRSGISDVFIERDSIDVINDTFGSKYNDAIKRIKFAEEHPKDFNIKSRRFNKLNDSELRMVNQITLWRHHSFEWILAEEEWQEVDTST